MSSTSIASTLAKVLSAADIMAAVDLKPEPVEVPEWGGTIYLRVLTADETLAYQEFTQVPENKFRSMQRLLSYCICDEKGGRLFSDAEMAQLYSKNANVLTRLHKLAVKMNAAEDAVADAKKDSGEAVTDASPIDSPAS